MPIYPLLTPLEQANLPRLIATPTALASKFADSTHYIFLCDTTDGRMVLKVCNEAAVTKSGFWKGFNGLFGADFPNSLGAIKQTHDLLSDQGLYAVPEFMASNYRFVLTRFVAGEDLDAGQVTNIMVEQLAQHIAQLHQAPQSIWGAIHAPIYQAADWRKRFHAELLSLAAQSAVAIPKALLQDVLTQASQLQETEFVPIMLDCRWDQFRRLGNAEPRNTLALVDLDAFVMGPRTLELVLLEYVLTSSQFLIFKNAYMVNNDWPDYAMQKPCYQLLLFLMQVLGETDLAKWMRQL